MDYTYDELDDYIDRLCRRLNITKVPLSLDSTINTSFNSVTFGHESYINVNPFCSHVNIMPIETILAHEVRHAWQYANNMLKPLPFYGKGLQWLGKVMPYTWHTAPWEIDAVNFENEIAIELGYPILRFVNNGTIFTLDKPSELNLEQKQLALRA